MGADIDAVEDAGRRAERSRWLDHAVRFGLVAYGLVHLVVAWLGLQLALGERSGRPDARGALHELAQQPLGEVVLLLVACGMLLLVAWRLVELCFDHRDEGAPARWRRRVVAVGTGVAYAAIGASALGVVVGNGGSGREEETWTARLMSWPAGPWLVAAVGAGLLGYTAGMAWRGLTGGHARLLTTEGRSGEAGTAYVLVGTVGYLAKGAAVGIVGALVLWAAWSHDPQKSGGLDQALGRLLHQPLGPWLLGAVSVGLAGFGLFQLARARHLSR